MQGDQHYYMLGEVRQGLGKRESPYTSTTTYIYVYLYIYHARTTVSLV